MKKLSVLVIAVSAALASLTAAAEGFSGPYLGIYGGKAFTTDDGKEFDGDTFDGYRQETNPDQLQYGLLAGYNWDIGNNVVLGLEADYEGRDNQDDSDYQDYLGVTDTDYEASTRIKAGGSFRGRAGYVFNNPYYVKNQTMLYVTAGYATVEAERKYKDFNSNESTSTTDWQEGWTAGAGVEYLIDANFAARLEYRHSDYGTENVNENPWDLKEKQSLSEDSVRLGASYQF
ncbi:outer membrane protein [Pseudomonas sp. N040]|uniref:outer membrane protein n=1 Tax=Pseudomonas sp. N040 TaxID=2785325 RepID=UPI0018A33B12|nr:outer membrane beta-barrel protein [Pseudomonas sp. N040]MBF7730961.1 porin family protein [Pseudomonas sp. N040]MBW7014604.1 outer membrane beta-barrel protein [Pseudomonas sp. N040]